MWTFNYKVLLAFLIGINGVVWSLAILAGAFSDRAKAVKLERESADNGND